MKIVITAILFRKIFYMVVFFLSILVFTSSCQKNPTKIDKYEWKSLGFEDRFALRLRLYEPYLYVCAGSNGLWRTNIQTENSKWEYLGLADTSLGDYFNRGVLDVVVDLNNPNIMLVAFAPDDARDHGVFKSIDRGTTWVPSDSGMEFEMFGEKYYSHPDVFLQAPSYLFAAGTSLFMTHNLGKFWEKIIGVHGGAEVGPAQATYSLEKHPRNLYIIWIGGETVYFGPFIMYSKDSGNSWHNINLNRVVPVDNAVYSIAFDPEDYDIVYLGMQGAIIKTTDGGKTWIVPLVTHRSGGWFRGLAADPTCSGHLFAAGGKTVIETHDGGQTWEEIENPNETQVLSMLYDSENKSLYLGTETGVFVYRP